MATALESLETRRLLSVTLSEEIHDDPPQTDGLIGQFMAARGNLILVGQPNFNVDLDNDQTIESNEIGIGHALLFSAAGGAPIEIPNPEPNQDDFFGSAVAFIGDDKIAITSIDNPSNIGTGSVYIYDLVNGVPTASPAVEITGGGSGAVFGGTLASVGGDILIADTQGGPGNTSGAVYRYSAAGQLLDTYSFGGMNDALGQDMATNEADGHVLITARGVNFSPLVLEFDETGTLVQTYENPDAAPGEDFFGLAFNGTSILAGDVARGRALEFNRDDASIRRTINNPDPSQSFPSELFGAEIAISGNNLIITAQLDIDDDTGLTRGVAYVYDATSTVDDPAPIDVIDNPTYTAAPPLAGATDQFGYQLGVLGNGDVVISDPTDDASGATDAGGLYVFSLGNIVPAAPTAQLDGQGNLIVTGTGDGETIVVRRDNGSPIRVFVNDVQLGGDFAVTGEVVINGGGGNDTLTSDPTNNFPTEIYGGDGNDTITGGGGDDFLFGEGDSDTIVARQGSDVALGGDDGDTLFGGQGRDILIGGDGADRVEGEQADDILVAATTAHDGDLAALASIRATWLSPSDYATRVFTLASSLLDPDDQVFDDGDVDTVVGGQGQDWFLVQASSPFADVLVDLKKSEVSDDIDTI